MLTLKKKCIMITVLLWSALMILPSGIASASAKPISRNAKELADDKALFQEIEDQWENDYFHEAVVSPGDTKEEVDAEIERKMDRFVELQEMVDSFSK